MPLLNMKYFIQEKNSDHYYPIDTLMTTAKLGGPVMPDTLFN